jgi:hypothetical protein
VPVVYMEQPEQPVAESSASLLALVITSPAA